MNTRPQTSSAGARSWTAPKVVGEVLSRLPQYPPSALFAAALNLAPDWVLPRDTLAPLQGKTLSIGVLDLGTTVSFALRGRRFEPCRGRIKPDLVICATAYDFLQLALRREDPDTLFFHRRLVMEGDTDLGLLLKNTLDALDLPIPDPGRLPPFNLLRRLLP